MRILKNPFYFAISVLIFSLGFILLFWESFFPAGLIVVLIGLLLMIHWNTISYQWVCDECGNSFDINMFQNFVGLNGGINHKYLYCPSCEKRTWCKGVPK